MDDASLPTLVGNRITIAIDPVALVVTECITVTSAMRKHARWAHSSISSILGSTSRPSSEDSEGSSHKRSGLRREIDLINGDSLLTSRYGLRGKKGQSLQDNPLMSAFAKLRADLKHCKDIQTFDAPSLLQPFTQVIRSSSTTAPITSLALIAITKMLAYRIVNPQTPNFAYAIQLLAATVTHCRFEGDNSPSDEVVFLRILKLMEDMICGEAGDVLGDQSVCEMMECALSICCHLRMSEVLRRSAEISMVTMCQAIFARLRTLEAELGQEPSALEETVAQEDMDAAKIDSSPNAELGPDRMAQTRTSANLEPPGASANGDRPSIDGTASVQDFQKADELTEMKPYGLPSIRELFRVLADLLDPHDRQRTDTLRVMALRIVNVALEVAGPSIATHPSLASLAKDTLCRNLFQLVRSENIALLHESLRVAGTLLATCRPVLRLQQELFLSYVVACLHPKVPIPDEPSIDPSLYQGVPQAPALVKPSPAAGGESGRATPVPVRDRQKLGMEGGSRKPDAREAMIESVGGLVRIPSFMVELFVNYDCDVDRSDLCTDMVGLLSRNAFPDSATWSTTNVPPLCLDSLLGYVQFIADRLDDEPVTDGLPDRKQLQEQRRRKDVIIRGTTKFNDNPKGGIAFLAAQGIIADPSDPECVTAFLKGTSRIDKKMLGEFISKRNNEAILDAFMNQFDFRGQRVDEALRQLLNSFRLPGESALIERIVTVFSEQYFGGAEPSDVADKDAVFILTYAIIMLNTDAYNPNIKAANRMTFTDFARNLRGVNGGQNFDQQYLQDIYDAIKSREIVLPEEHDNKHAFEHAWKELLVKAQTTPNLALCTDTNAYDADMFAATWRPIVATLNYVFVSATEDAVFQRVTTGYSQLAQIAAKYGVHECIDHIITSLSKISTLAGEGGSTALNTEIVAQGKSIMVSKFAVEFGRNVQAELATLVLFRIINGCEAVIRDGWTPIVKIIVNLFVNSLIPTSFKSISRDLDLPPIPLQSPAQVIERNEKSSDVGLFSAFTNYVSSVMNDEPPEPNDAEIDATLCTVDYINACRFEEILGNVSELSVVSLKTLTLALLAQLPEQDSPPLTTVKPEVHAPMPTRLSGSKGNAEVPTYNPAVVYVLELATILALRDEETIAVLGEDVSAALQSIIRDAHRLHPIALSRTVFYLLSLLRASYDHGYIRAPVVLHAISSFRPEVLRQCAQPILKGLYGCISGPAELKHELASSPDFWAVLNTLQPLQVEAASLVSQITEVVVADGAITPDNYEAAVILLNNFASAASVNARQEQQQQQQQQQRDRNSRRGAQKTSSAEDGKDTAADDAAKKVQKAPVVLRGVRAITLVSQLASRVPALVAQSHLEPAAAWRTYWSPVFRCLAQQCGNPCREIRQQSFPALQRILLSPELATPEHDEWTNIFGEVLFPMVNVLLKPETYQADPAGMAATRVQAAQLLSRIFLHYLVLRGEGDWAAVTELWVRILTIMDRFLNSGAGADGMGVLLEAVPECLKNILLVMSSGGYIVPPAKGEKDERAEGQKKLWNESRDRLERFLPGLIADVFPEADMAVKSPTRGSGARSGAVRSKEAGPTAPSSNGVASTDEKNLAPPPSTTTATTETTAEDLD